MDKGTARKSKKRLADLLAGVVFKDPETGKSVLVKDKKFGLPKLDLFDPESLPDQQEIDRRAAQKKRRKSGIK